MRQLIPASWKHAIETLRSAAHHLLDRWFHRHPHAVERAISPQTPVRLFAGWPSVDVEENDEAVLVLRTANMVPIVSLDIMRLTAFQQV